MSDLRLFPATVMPDRDWWHTLWPDPTGVLTAVGISPGMDAVDLCCGDGHFTAPMCELTAPGRTIGVDLDGELLGKARSLCAGHENFIAVQADARDLPELVRGQVDFVFIANTFHGVPDKPALARAVMAALKPGGRFAIVNWHRRAREQTPVLGQPRGPDTALRMTPQDVAEVVEPAGFLLERLVDIGPYHYGAVFLKPADPTTGGTDE